MPSQVAGIVKCHLPPGLDRRDLEPALPEEIQHELGGVRHLEARAMELDSVRVSYFETVFAGLFDALEAEGDG